MSREGRSQPIQPFAAHGFLGNVPANGTLPSEIVVVENLDDRRRKTLLLQPFTGTAQYQSVVFVPPVFPQASVSVENPDDRRRKAALLQPTVEHGFLDNFPANGTLPIPSVVVENLDDRRRKTLLLQPFVGTAQYESVVFIPPVTPPAPVVVPVQAPRRVLPDPATVESGFDISIPQLPDIIENLDKRRWQSVQPVILSGVLATNFQPFVAPPAPVLVEIASGSRRRTTDPVVIKGVFVPAVASGFTPRLMLLGIG